MVLGSRRPELASKRLASAGVDLAALTHRTLRFEARLDAAAWSASLRDVDVVLNCVGILRPVGRATYDRVHHLAPRALASAAKRMGKRLVHVSALGLHADAGSRFITSKLAGERAIEAVGGDAIIVRPSLLDGAGGYGAAWLRGVARLPAFVVPTKAKGRIAALRVEDLGEALARLCALPQPDRAAVERAAGTCCVELGGPEHYTFETYIQALRSAAGLPPGRALRVPSPITRLVAHVCDLLHFTPFSYGHWELLHRDNVPVDNQLPHLLRHPARAIGGA